MTVKELIEALHRYNGDLEVRAHWENTTVAVKEVRVSLKKPASGKDLHSDLFVEIDVDK